MTDTPTGDLMIQTVPMPADTNSNGEVFGGWVLSQMDIAGGVAAANGTWLDPASCPGRASSQNSANQ